MPVRTRLARFSGTHTAALLTGLLCMGLLGASTDARSAQSPRTPVASTPGFAFFSDYETNLHDALMDAGTERRFERAELFQAGPEQACFERLARSSQAGWNLAVEYYREMISPHGFLDRPQYLLRTQLADLPGQPEGVRAERFRAIAAGFRAAAAPAYSACRWRAQDEENRRWIAAAIALLEQHEQALTARLESLYQTTWSGRPIPVDIVAKVSWSGANSVITEPGGHLLIATEFRGPAALEIIFHEASHLLVERSDPLQRTLQQAGKALGIEVPRDLWHPLMFYTTGEAVRAALVDAGITDYTPMIFEIFGRSPWGRFRPAIEQAWPAYLDGETSMENAALALMKAIEAASPADDDSRAADP